MKIGILGGSFDPIHTEHIRVAKTVRKKLRLDVVLLVPTFRNPYKLDRQLATPQDRLAMVRRAVRRHPGLRASDIEIRRGGVSYTVDTLRALGRRFPRAELFLLMGSDVVPTLSSWKSPRKIVELATLAVFHRPGKTLGRIPIPGARAIPVSVRTRAISSTAVRDRTFQGVSIAKLVDPAVRAYIISRGLYRRKTT